MTVTPSPQSVVPVGPKRVLVLKSAVERLILAADMYGVAHLDSDDMDDDAVELQDATEGMKDALAAAPAPSSLAGGEVLSRLIEVLKRLDDGVYASLNDQAEAILAVLSPEAPAREGVDGAVERAFRFGYKEGFYEGGAYAALTPRHEAPASEGDVS